MTERLSDERLAELEALAEVATPGPWECVVRDYYNTDIGGYRGATIPGIAPDYEPMPDVHPAFDSVADAEFIAASRAALPALLAEVREYRARLSRFAAVSLGPIAYDNPCSAVESVEMLMRDLGYEVGGYDEDEDDDE